MLCQYYHHGSNINVMSLSPSWLLFKCHAVITQWPLFKCYVIITIMAPI